MTKRKDTPARFADLRNGGNLPSDPPYLYRQRLWFVLVLVAFYAGLAWALVT